MEHAFQPLAEGVQAHEGQKALDEARRAFSEAFEVGQLRAKLLDHAVMAAEYGDRQIAKAHVFSKHRQQGLDDARTKAATNDHAVNVASVQRARSALDTERSDKADPLTDGDGEFFEIRRRGGADARIEVLDVQPSDRHLLLMVREGDQKPKYLCGHDERHWFVAAVPESAPVGTVAATPLIQSMPASAGPAPPRRRSIGTSVRIP